MNWKQFTSWCKGRGLFVIKRNGEIYLNFKGGKDDTAYYTQYLDDAIDTAQQMVGGR